MNSLGLALMIFSLAFVLALNIFCFVMVFRMRRRRKGA